MFLRIVILAALVSLSAHGIAQSSPLVNPGAKIGGKTQGEWSQEWWQWAGSFLSNESPIADQNGDKCHLKQSGDVWFLAGTYSSGRTTRTCTVPKDKYLFFPLINYVVMPAAGAKNTCASVTETARVSTDSPAVLVLEIDGKKFDGLDRHRQTSPGCFDMAAKANSPIRIFLSAANGYYAMLAPLSEGSHVINFGGVLPGAIQAITYKLAVR